MAIPHAAPGIPVDLQPSGESLTEATTSALVKTDQFEAIRLFIPKGHEVCRNHQVKGPITVQCLQGEVAFSVEGETHTLRAGHWLYLPGEVSHSMSGVEDSLILLTIMFA